MPLSAYLGDGVAYRPGTKATVDGYTSDTAKDRQIAERMQLGLTEAGHQVFFDKESLPADGDYHARIAIEQSDKFIYLVAQNP